MTNITPPSTQTDDEPTSRPEPRCLDLEDKSKGSPTPADSSTKSTGKDEHHDLEDGDLPGASLSEADQKMDKVYRDHVHQNPGMHLTGGTADDAIWQEHW